MTNYENRLPVTALSDFLGAGETTLPDHVPRNRAGQRVAVIVNDMSEINVDAELVRNGGAKLSRTEEHLANVVVLNEIDRLVRHPYVGRERRRQRGHDRFSYSIIAQSLDTDDFSADAKIAAGALLIAALLMWRRRQGVTPT
jgi:hypothetical protein